MSEAGIPAPTESDRQPPKWADVSQAKAEEKNWDDENRLKGVKLGNDILWHRVYGWIVAFMMCFLTLVFAVSLTVWIVHHITPFGWLIDDQLSRIQSFIFSSSIGAVVSTYMQKQLHKV